MWPNLYLFAHSETGSRFVKIRLKLEIKFIQSVFIYSRNTNLKIYKNEKIVNRNKTDQIRAQKKNNNNNNNDNNDDNNNNNFFKTMVCFFRTKISK